MTSSTPSESADPAAGATVLVVDDDELQRGEIVDFLSRQGLNVLAEENGFAAVHTVRNTKARVVVLDMKMPGLDGLQVSRLLSRLEDPPQVILMSGYPEYVYRAHAEQSDVFAVLEKPVPLAALMRFVSDALKQPSS
ncbi:MAG: response regulator [Alphaproteobacteria bacterium]|nr:response regulator [Alphaproteobacteria bacterium]